MDDEENKEKFFHLPLPLVNEVSRSLTLMTKSDFESQQDSSFPYYLKDNSSTLARMTETDDCS